MRKKLMILFLSLSITLIFGCVKDDGKAIYKEEPNPQINNSQIDKPQIEKPQVEKPDINEKKEDIVYKDDLYGFSLIIPASWEGKYTIERETWIDGKSKSVAFNFKEGDIFNNIFTIVIMDESIPEEEWGELFLIYIVEEGGKTFSYLNIMEPTEELLEEENKDKLETVTEMVESVHKIIETFKIEK